MNRSWEIDRDAYSQLGQRLTAEHNDRLLTQLQVLQSALVNFASEHGEEIKLNSEFRTKFTQMCLLANVDPLQLVLQKQDRSKNKNDNFSVALAVRIVEVAQATRGLNGGLMSINELLVRLNDNPQIPLNVGDDDVQKGLAILTTLGQGYNILDINGKKWLKFSSATGTNISSDEKSIYELSGFMGGFVTYRLLIDNYGWDKVRCKTVIDDMIMNGFLWVDEGSNEPQFWVPSWISS